MHILQAKDQRFRSRDVHGLHEICMSQVQEVPKTGQSLWICLQELSERIVRLRRCNMAFGDIMKGVGKAAANAFLDEFSSTSKKLALVPEFFCVYTARD